MVDCTKPARRGTVDGIVLVLAILFAVGGAVGAAAKCILATALAAIVGATLAAVVGAAEAILATIVGSGTDKGTAINAPAIQIVPEWRARIAFAPSRPRRRTATS